MVLPALDANGKIPINKLKPQAPELIGMTP